MLQQTQVDRVRPKYKEFLRKFPTVRALAEAKTADVIKAWAGLGYNRRAIYLKKTAIGIVNELGGRFPRDAVALEKFPGIGEYTARAMLSFAFGMSVAVLDTNHRRWYQRVFFGIRKKSDDDLWHRADAFLKKNFEKGARAYHWNQALMDFGSALCLASQPKCGACPVAGWCAYRRAETRIQREKTKLDKKYIPFKESDRFVRGRIIDALRSRNRMRTTELRALFPNVSDARLDRIVQKLERDELLSRRGGSILLP